MRYLSLFSGIEAATVAWAPLGWECVAVAEIEPFPCAVLAHHYPNIPNLGDVTKIDELDILMLGHIDLLVFGSPCQDLSVAGKRAGLSGERSGLFHTAITILEWLRKHCGTRYALWENVPGAFSSNRGADFAVVVGELAGASVEVPPKGWGNEGALVGEKGMVEWSTLDAQWRGVAQRRRRVFAFADFGDWAGRCPVLLEPESLRGDSAPNREAGERVTGTVEARTRGGGFPGSDGAAAAAGHVVAVGCERLGVEQGYDILGVPATNGAKQTDVHVPLRSRLPGQSEASTTTVIVSHAPEIAGTLTAGYARSTGRDLAEMPGGIQVVHSLRADGFDASEDGTGRGTPLIVDTVPTMQTGSGHAAGHGARSGDTKDAYIVPVGFYPTEGRDFVAYDDVSPSVKVGSGGSSGNPPGMQHGMQVRRLTPRECERLQGFPEDYTLVTYRGKPAADGPRYKALGNSMAVPVMWWIGDRISLIEQFQ